MSRGGSHGGCGRSDHSEAYAQHSQRERANPSDLKHENHCHAQSFDGPELGTTEVVES